MRSNGKVSNERLVVGSRSGDCLVDLGASDAVAKHGLIAHDVDAIEPSHFRGQRAAPYLSFVGPFPARVFEDRGADRPAGVKAVGDDRGADGLRHRLLPRAHFIQRLLIGAGSDGVGREVAAVPGDAQPEEVGVEGSVGVLAEAQDDRPRREVVRGKRFAERAGIDSGLGEGEAGLEVFGVGLFAVGSAGHREGEGTKQVPDRVRLRSGDRHRMGKRRRAGDCFDGFAGPRCSVGKAL